MILMHLWSCINAVKKSVDVHNWPIGLLTGTIPVLCSGVHLQEAAAFMPFSMLFSGTLNLYLRKSKAS